MNLFGPVRWRFLGLLTLLLGAPTLLLVHPLPTLSVLGAFGAVFGARALWRAVEPIPPELTVPDRPLGLPPPDGGPPALRRAGEPVGAAGVARAVRRSLNMAQTYARTAMVFLALSAGSFGAGLVMDLRADAGTAGLLLFAAQALLAVALALGTAGVGLMVRDSRREARDAEFDGG